MGEVEEMNVTDVKSTLAKQVAASATLANAREEVLAAITAYDFKGNPPLAMARLISKTLRRPDNSLPSLEDSLVLALHWYETGLNPFMGEIYLLPSGRIGMSLQGELKKARGDGHKLGAPKFESVTREWPKMNGKPIELVRKVKGTETAFHFEQEPGCKCSLQVDDGVIEYTAYLTEWFMPYNPNWWDRMQHMLMIRSFSNAISFGTGVAVSQEIATAESPSDSQVIPPKVAAAR